jgi:lysozyme
MCKALAAAVIERHEGRVLDAPYYCTGGKLTWGVGRNIQDAGLSCSELVFLLAHGDDLNAVADLLLDNDLNACIADLEQFSFWDRLCDVRKAALVDFRFNVGAGGFRKFKKMIAALNYQDYVKAGWELRSSLWYTQVGRRAKVIENMIKTGDM